MSAPDDWTNPYGYAGAPRSPAEPAQNWGPPPATPYIQPYAPPAAPQPVMAYPAPAPYVPVVPMYSPMMLPPAAAPNGFGIGGMVVGIVGIFFCWAWWFGLPLPIIGLVLSVIGMAKGNQDGTSNGQAIAGLILNAISLVVAVIVIVAVGSILAIFHP